MNRQCCTGSCSQGRTCPLAVKYETRRPLFWRIAESKPFAVAFYVAAVVTVILANLEKLA